ncbi:hypothetical protein TYRP_018840 [Tyrophagus putrescentiae]|nr:hypothetical protein TYRP_018840 [Tyrophagus putrescentiae]
MEWVICFSQAHQATSCSIKQPAADLHFETSTVAKAICLYDSMATVWEYENRKIDVNKYNMLPTGVFRANKNKSQQGDQLFPMHRIK